MQTLCTAIQGNKGGVSVRLSYTPNTHADKLSSPGPTVFTFVNSHLAAFDEMVERRHADFQDLSNRLLFDPSPSSSKQYAGLTSALGAAHTPATERSSIYDSDVVFWMVFASILCQVVDDNIR